MSKDNRRLVCKWNDCGIGLRAWGDETRALEPLIDNAWLAPFLAEIVQGFENIWANRTALGSKMN